MSYFVIFMIRFSRRKVPAWWSNRPDSDGKEFPFFVRHESAGFRLRNNPTPHNDKSIPAPATCQELKIQRVDCGSDRPKKQPNVAGPLAPWHHPLFKVPALLGRYQGHLLEITGGRGLLSRERQLQVTDDPVDDR